MTTYHLNLTMAENPPVNAAAPPAARPSRILASLVTEDPETMAATLRAVADRLDPLKPPHPVMRGRSGPIDFEDPAVRGAVVRVEPWMRRQTGEVLPPVRSRELHPEYLDEDAPMYAHDPECNTLHDGPDPCPAPVTIEAKVDDAVRKVSRGVLDRARGMEPVTENVRVTSGPLTGMYQRRTRGGGSRATPDGCGPEHTFTGSCIHADPN